MSMNDTIANVHESSARSDAAYAPIVDTLPVACGVDGSPHEWRPMPGELVSLWEMLRIYAADFVTLMKIVGRFEVGMSSIAARVESEGIDKKAACKGKWDSVAKWLDEVEPRAKQLELNHAIDKVRRMRDEFQGEVFEVSDLRSAIKELGDRIEDQLKDRILMFVPIERAKFLIDAPPPFGELVQDKFSGITADVVDAGWCLGMGRATAAVYHLMRVMEFGVRRLAKRLKLPKGLEHRPWGDILQAARNAIAALPYASSRERNKRDLYSETVAHLDSVKDAWRNPTMHSRRRYSQEEAEAIYSNVKAFMNHLADKVF